MNNRIFKSHFSLIWKVALVLIAVKILYSYFYTPSDGKDSSKDGDVIYQKILKYQFDGDNKTIQKLPRLQKLQRLPLKFVEDFGSSVELIQHYNQENNLIRLETNRFDEFTQLLLHRIRTICNKNTYLLNIVNSHPLNFKLRETIRLLHGNHSHKFKYRFKHPEDKEKASHCTLFAIGFSSNKGHNKKIDMESSKHRDVIRVPFIEDYRKMASKILWILKFSADSEVNFRYLLKSDDDAYIDVLRFLPYLYESDREYHYGGRVIKNSPTDRWILSRSYMSRDEYESDTVEVFVLGASVLVNRNLTQCLWQHFLTQRFIPMEDVLLTELAIICNHYPDDMECLYYDRVVREHWPKSFSINIGRDVPDQSSRINKFKRDIYS